MNVSNHFFLPTSWYSLDAAYRLFEKFPYILPIGLRIAYTLPSSPSKPCFYKSDLVDSPVGDHPVTFFTPCAFPIGNVYGDSTLPPLFPKFTFIVY